MTRGTGRRRPKTRCWTHARSPRKLSSHERLITRPRSAESRSSRSAAGARVVLPHRHDGAMGRADPASGRRVFSLRGRWRVLAEAAVARTFLDRPGRRGTAAARHRPRNCRRAHHAREAARGVRPGFDRPDHAQHACWRWRCALADRLLRARIRRAGRASTHSTDARGAGAAACRRERPGAAYPVVSDGGRGGRSACRCRDHDGAASPMRW